MAAGDELLAELAAPVRAGEQAATMGRLQKCSYTHKAMVDLIIEHPEYSQNQLAHHFGYTPGWISNVLASDAFQEQLEARKELIIDPALKATITERFRALTIRSLEILHEKLNKPNVSDTVVLRSVELGAKALGVGGNAPPQKVESSADRLERLAARLENLNRPVQGAVYENAIQDAEVIPTSQGGQGQPHPGQVYRQESGAGESPAGAVRADGLPAGAAA